MICPKCHNENKYDALTCDFCMAPLPMSKASEVEINKKKKIEKKNKMSKSMTKLVGLLMGIFILVAIVVIAFIVRKH
jgi:hypothetical protein